MINWSDCYFFCAEEVEALGKSDNMGCSHPYTLTVYLKSGKSLSINYANTQSRKADMIDLSRQIDREKRRDMEKIHKSFYLLRDSVNRVDKRQLRIWRQLRDLLGVKVEDFDHE